MKFLPYLLYYAKACNELADTRVIATGLDSFFEEMSQRWRFVDKTISDLRSLGIEAQTSRSRGKHTNHSTKWPTLNLITSVM